MSLIVAKCGIDIGVVSPFILPIVGTITIISTLLSRYLIKLGLTVSERVKESNTKAD